MTDPSEVIECEWCGGAFQFCACPPPERDALDQMMVNLYRRLTTDRARKHIEPIIRDIAPEELE